MSQYEADPITEAHRELDQLARVSMATLMQMSEAVARRGARKAGSQRDEQVAIAQGAGAQLQADYASQQATLAGHSPVAGDEPTVPGSPRGGGKETVTERVQDVGATSAAPSVDLTNDNGAAGTAPGAAASGPDQYNATPGDGAPAAAPVTLEALLGTAHPMPVRDEVGAAAAVGPASGPGAAVEGAQELAVVQGARFDSGHGIGR